MGCTGPVDPEDPPSCVTGRGGEVKVDASLGRAGGDFPPGVAFAWLLARHCGGGDLAGSTFTEGGAELGNFAPDERGRLALAVPLLFAVKAAGPIVSVGIVAEGT